MHFQYGSTDLARLFAIEERIEKSLVDAHTGEFDGNEVATDGSDGFLYMYGPDADRLFATILPILESCDFIKGATVKLRYGLRSRYSRAFSCHPRLTAHCSGRRLRAAAERHSVDRRSVFHPILFLPIPFAY